MYVFCVGDRVVKTNGYRYPGEVIAVVRTRQGKTRYVVECTVPEVEGMLHIFSPEQLALDPLWADENRRIP